MAADWGYASVIVVSQKKGGYCDEREREVGRESRGHTFDELFVERRGRKAGSAEDGS